VRARLKFIFPALSIGIFLAAADQTIIVSSYGRIGSDLNALNKTTWLATAYFCTTTALQPLYGQLSNVFGRKACLLFAYFVFGAGALFCGLAPDMTQLIIARALTGIGAGGILTTVSILLSDVVTLEERGLWQGYVNMVFACGAGLGAPLGGLLSDAVGWRWAFIGQAPLCGIAVLLVAVLLHVPTHQQHEDDTSSKLARIDFLGAISLIIWLASLLVFLDHMSAGIYHWPSFIWLGVAITFLVVFLRVEAIVTNPLMPLHLLFGQVFLGAYLALFFGNVAWYGVLFYVPLLYQAVGGFSASAAGTLLLPGIVAGVIGGLACGTMIKRNKGTGFAKAAGISYPLVIASCLGIALGSGLFGASIPLATIIAILSVCLIVGGLGNGGGMTSTLVVVVAVARPEDQAIVTACVYFYRQLGTTVGLAVISLVFRQVLAWRLLKRLAGAPDFELDTEETVKRVIESLKYLGKLPAEIRAIVEISYGEACKAALLVCMGLAICAFINVPFIREKR
ncbi:MFS general substrate transporter, partial [Cucurbitaria berberidis CBS 394.84]